MAGSVNKVILVGNLGNDPEVRSFQNGGRVANLSVATSESWKDRESGERREKTQWHRVVVTTDGLVGICERFLRKGSKVYIEGQLETRKYTDNSGTEKYTTEVVLRPFNSTLTMLDGRSGGSEGGSSDYSSGASSSFDNAPSGGSFADTQGGASGIDDEIPF